MASLEEFLESQELKHYGVPGMKWGRRKDRKSGVTPSSDHREAQALKKKSLPELSNKELRDLTNRQNLEQQYTRLNPGTRKRGSAAVKAAIAVAGTGLTVYNMSTSPGGKAAIEAGNRIVKRSVIQYRAARAFG